MKVDWDQVELQLVQRLFATAAAPQLAQGHMPSSILPAYCITSARAFVKEAKAMAPTPFDSAPPAQSDGPRKLLRGSLSANPHNYPELDPEVLKQLRDTLNRMTGSMQSASKDPDDFNGTHR